MPDRDGAGVPKALLPLLREIGDLKRIRSAGRRGTIATRLFAQGWRMLAAGLDPRACALRLTAAALAAARLGDLDGPALRALGLPDGDAVAIRRAAIAEIGTVLDPALRTALIEAVAASDEPGDAAPFPFVEALADQPRAGVTCPGRPRIVLQPPETHAEHCLAVAVYGVLLSPVYGADPATVFLAAMAHHLHNAAMPDSGFTGETLLGDHLLPAMERATDAALAELPDALKAVVTTARTILPDDGTPAGRAFHAADVLDRVLEIEQHLVVGRLTMDTVLGEMELVHAGPVKPFHDRVLAEVGLL